MIGGFGNCSGEIDIWDINTMKQVGKTKSHCAVGIEWAPDGKTLMTSVLYARVKVDNMVTLFNANGNKVLTSPLLCTELHWAQWQPRLDTFTKETFVPMDKQEGGQKAEGAKPKRSWNGGGSTSAFAQAMR
jgi:uncharacterized protein with WD repeat